MTTEQQPQRTMLDRCAARCVWSSCTGKGHQLHTSHRCPLGPVPPPPPCNVCGDPSVDRFLPGWRCTSCSPSYPTPTPLPPGPTRPAPDYGTATTDPLGRTGPPNQYRLPTRAGDQ